MRRLALSLLAVSFAWSASGLAKDVEAQNKAVARSFFEDVLDKGKLEDYAKSHAPDFVAHSRRPPRLSRGRHGRRTRAAQGDARHAREGESHRRRRRPGVGVLDRERHEHRGGLGHSGDGQERQRRAA